MTSPSKFICFLYVKKIIIDTLTNFSLTNFTFLYPLKTEEKR